jgi:hypothetical protein
MNKKILRLGAQRVCHLPAAAAGLLEHFPGDRVASLFEFEMML